MGFKNINLKGKVNNKYEKLFIKGSPGSHGKSSYEIAVDNGYQETEEKFAEQLKNLCNIDEKIYVQEYHFENDQSIYIHDDDLFYNGRSITEIFKDIENRLVDIETELLEIGYLVTGSEFRYTINRSMWYLIRSDTPPDSTIKTSDISRDQDGSIVTWYDTTSYTQYIYTSKKTIRLNPNCDEMFSTCVAARSLDIIYDWDASKVTTMKQMFNKCSSLTSLDLSNWNTSNVTNMSDMFSGCSKLTSLDLSNWDTSNVTDMYGMFHTCSSLVPLNISHFDTSNVVNMSYMFGYTKLTSLDLSMFDTSKVTNMSEMFIGCSSLTTLDLSHFDTSNVTNMEWMFYKCNNLISLDLSNWYTPKVTSMKWMFYDCTKLTLLNLSDTFILSNSMYTSSSIGSVHIYNPTYYMYRNCTANKPTGGNWDLGTWDDSTGTFVKS